MFERRQEKVTRKAVWKHHLRMKYEQQFPYVVIRHLSGTEIRQLCIIFIHNHYLNLSRLYSRGGH